MEDARSIFEQYAQDGDVTRYLTWQPHRNIEETHDYLRRCMQVWEDGTAFPWAITRKEDDRLVGVVEIRMGGHKVDLGYVLARVYWGRGYMPEAVQVIVEWALKQEGIYRVWAVCDVENHASARVLEKVGMQREGTLRRWMAHLNMSDEPRDCHCYAKVR